MKVGILGQGAAGLILAIMLKLEDSEVDVTLIDKNTVPGRKLLATGNGRCNLGNHEIKDNSYNSEEALKIVKDFDVEKQISFLKEIGILTRDINNLVYPFSLSAKSYLDSLVSVAREKKVKFINGENLLDYEAKDGKVKVTTSKKNFVFDKFVFASGNQSAPQLGGSETVLNLLAKKEYGIVPSKSGLAPVRTIENTKIVENQRIKGKITLNIDKKVAYEEEGEVLFKKDGISGISIFNASSIIARSPKFKKATINVDLFPGVSSDDLYKDFSVFNVVGDKSFLNGIFTKEVAEFVRRGSGVKNLYMFTPSEIRKIATYVKNIEFTYRDTYPFSDAQVAVGGIKFSEVNENLESKKEPGVYFAGEILDADGLCGGYNLMFAFASANKVKEALLVK